MVIFRVGNLVTDIYADPMHLPIQKVNSKIGFVGGLFIPLLIQDKLTD